MALFFTIMLIGVIGLHAQDKFDVTRLTFDPAQEGFPIWSADGKRIAFNCTRSENFDIWIMEVDVEQVKKELQVLND